MTEKDEDQQLLDLIHQFRDLQAKVVPLRVEHERHLEQLREIRIQLGVVPCLVRIVDGRLVDSAGVDIVFPGHLDFARVLGGLRDVESRLATVSSRLAELGVPVHVPDSRQ